MAYLGSPPASQFFAPGTDTFSGTGSQTAFTLSRNVATVNDIQVVVNNVVQQPSNYTVANNILTFSPAPSAGTDNIYVRYLSTNLISIVPSATGTANSTTFLRGDNTWAVVSVTPTAVSDQTNTSTGYFDLPSGTTAQRPASPPTGATRYNTTTGYPEWYDGTTWYQFNQSKAYSIAYLVVSGGGGGASGGGGAGGLTAVASLTVTPLTNYSIVVGSGGAFGTGNSTAGTDGGVSSGFGTSTVGGGGGGTFSNTAGNNGRSGGSGGGAGGSDTGQAGAGSGGAGTAGQGFAGGAGVALNTFQGRGGGGGAGAVGANASGSTGGAGGVGYTWLNGTTYAGGGGGGGGTGAAGGSGGGGNGGNSSATGGAATANTGGGGGGGGAQIVTNGGNGGSGVVIIRYAGSQVATGGTVTSAGGYTYHTFTTSGTFTA